MLYVDYLIKKNASNLAEDIHLGGNVSGYIYTPYGRIRDVSYALEGYIANDPRRLPNIQLPDVSKHVYGWAVDISVGALHIDGTWKQQGSVIDEIAHRYGLKRPYNSQNYIWYVPPADRFTVTQEWWHFEREFGFR